MYANDKISISAEISGKYETICHLINRLNHRTSACYCCGTIAHNYGKEVTVATGTLE